MLYVFAVQPFYSCVVFIMSLYYHLSVLLLLDCTPSLVCQYIFVEYVNVQSDTRISLPSSLKT